MRIHHILILGAAAWMGAIYYNRFHAISNVADGGLFSLEKSWPSFGDHSIGRIGGLGTIGTSNSSRPSMLSGPPVVFDNPKDSMLLMQGAAKGNMDDVQEALEKHIKVDTRDNDRRTALIYASWGGHNDVVAKLLAAGANPHLMDRDSNGPLEYAAGRGLVDTVQMLLDKTHDKDRGYLEYAHLIQAALTGNTEALPRGKDDFVTVNRISPEEQSPLHLAAASGQIQLAEMLIKRGGRINLENHNHQTPLHWAAWNNQPEMIAWLIKKGASVSARDTSGNTPLILAVENKNAEAIQALLKNGADASKTNKEGKTALMIAQERRWDEITQLLQ